MIQNQKGNVRRFSWITSVTIYIRPTEKHSVSPAETSSHLRWLWIAVVAVRDAAFKSDRNNDIRSGIWIRPSWWIDWSDIILLQHTDAPIYCLFALDTCWKSVDLLDILSITYHSYRRVTLWNLSVGTKTWTNTSPELHRRRFAVI